MKQLSSIVPAAILALVTTGCSQPPPVQSVSGVEMATVGDIPKDKDGLTVEQRNVRRRVQTDNLPGSIKHVYVISAYSGQVILYSTAKGKVTSSGKRLTPNRITGLGYANSAEHAYMPEVKIGNTNYTTDEILGEDGTFGDSITYLYWWDTQDRYHQHYVSSGQIVHITDQPIAIKDIIIDLEATQKPELEKPK